MHFPLSDLSPAVMANVALSNHVLTGVVLTYKCLVLTLIQMYMPCWGAQLHFDIQSSDKCFFWLDVQVTFLRLEHVTHSLLTLIFFTLIFCTSVSNCENQYFIGFYSMWSWLWKGWRELGVCSRFSWVNSIRKESQTGCDAGMSYAIGIHCIDMENIVYILKPAVYKTICLIQ